MPYEEIQGEIMTMANNEDLGFSGDSTDFPGEHQTYIRVFWNSISGITGLGNWGPFNTEQIKEVLASELNNEEKRIKVNQLLYPQVTELLNSSDEDAWGSFRNSYANCVSVG